jgi:hypothetical protein
MAIGTTAFANDSGVTDRTRRLIGCEHSAVFVLHPFSIGPMAGQALWGVHPTGEIC